MKHPPHLWTIILDFGPAIPSFQQHHADEVCAKKAILMLKDRMNAGGGKCINRLELWHRNTLMTTYIPSPPVVIHLPSPDADGIIRLPEVRRKGALPSTKRTPSLADLDL